MWNFLRKLKMELPFDPAIPLLGLYSKYPEKTIQKNLCIPVFIAAQLITPKCWKQPKCPSINEWIQRLWYIYPMEYYAAERRSSYPLQQHGMELESIMPSEISLATSEGQIPYDLTFNWNIINRRKKDTKYNQRH